MTQEKESPKMRVRVLSEILGSWRAPEARRGDIIEVTREDFDKHGPRVLQDIEAEDRAAVEAVKPKVDPWFEEQRAALRADREASAVARAVTAEREAGAVAERAKALVDATKRK